MAEAIRLRRVAPVLPELVAVALAIPQEIGRLVLQGVVLQDPVLGGDAPAQGLRGGDDDAPGKGRPRLRRAIAQHRVVLDDRLLGTQYADARPRDRGSPARALAEVIVRVGLVV